MRLGPRSRWLASIVLALCLNATGLGLVGVMLRLPRHPGVPVMSGAAAAPVSLRVRLGLAPSAPSAPAPPALAAPQAVPEIAARVAPTVVSSSLAAISAAATEVLATDMATAEVAAAEAAETGAAGQAGPAGVAASGAGLETTRAELLERVDRLIRVNLAYPPLARARNIQGEVRVSLLIGTDGGLASSSMVSGSGSSILDKAAISLVRKIFPLGLDHELAEPVSIVVRIVYSLTS